MNTLYSGHGKFLLPASGAIFTDDYHKNLRPVISEFFHDENVPFALSGCTPSENGLVCSSFAKATYNSGTALDYHKAVAKFVFKSGTVFGIGMGVTCAYVSGTNLILATNYDGGSTAPTATETESISFSLVANEEYTITLEKRACTCIATLCRIKTNETVSATVSGVVTLCLGSPYVVVFSGSNVICNCFSYFVPLFNHVRAVIVGDSITEGVSQESDPTVRHAWKLMKDYFHGNCLISGVGWATTPSCKARVDSMLAMGYTFDTVIFLTGTNDPNVSGITTQTYQNIIDEYLEKGMKVVWSVPPMRSGREDAMSPIREKILATTNCHFIRFDYATQDANGDPDSTMFSDGTHLSVAGYQKCYEYALNELEALGV